MGKLLNDKSEPRLFRLEAAYTVAVMHYDLQQRMKCEEIYHRAVTIGEKKLSAKDMKMENETIMEMDPNTGRKSMKELMEGVLNDCKDNLYQLNTSTRGAARAINPNEKARMRHEFPIGRGRTTLTSEMINNLIDVGGIQCDYCKKKDVKLMKCSLCEKGFYCR
jgi:Ni2+-binding GTPase involved in maturation of urease and hydrogenase